MRVIKGTFTFYLHTFKTPERFSIEIEKNNILEIQSRGRFWEFSFISDIETDDLFKSWIDVSADALGFLLDFPIYSSYTNRIEQVILPPSDINMDSKINFDYVIHAMKYDEIYKSYIATEISKEVIFSASEMRDFIIKVKVNKLLSGAVYYYLKSIEEPEFFLSSLYNAHELIQNIGGISKTKTKKFKQLANDENIIGSRHTSKKTSILRSLSHEEREYCKNLIRNGILYLANK